MALDISDSGMLLGSSANATAELPSQAFAISLSGSVIEDMIACVQNGGDIQLALGSNPKFLFDDHEIRIPKTSDPSGYDLFLVDSGDPSRATRLPNPTMSILKALKREPKAKALKAPRLPGKGEPMAKKAPARQPAKSLTTTSNTAKGMGSQDGPEDAALRLERSLASLEADKRGNSAVIVGGLPSSKGAKLKASSRFLGAASPRSLPPSPALSGIGSPSLPPSSNTTQDRLKRLRFPIMHELAVQSLSREDLLARWDEGTEDEFTTALSKVADLDKDSQKWVLKRNSWKELDVFEYSYANEEDRRTAINNAIKIYDRMRISASDPLWQKLLPKSERGKGICLSRLQATIAKGPAGPTPRQKTDGASASGGDSERECKGGEAMSRSSSQTSTGRKKLSASEAQAKRLLSNSKRKATAATTAKPPSKAPTAKPATKGAPPKAARVKSKEFVSDSSSSDDEEPLSTSIGKPKASGAQAKPAQRAAEKQRAVEKTNEAPAAKAKPSAAAKAQPREQKSAKEQDTIRAQVIAKPIRPPTKRPRDADDDDSSSSGTPLSKRMKPAGKPLPAPVNSAKARTASDASQNSRGTSQGVPAPKPKNRSPVKSSPLASSPPTNASDMERDRDTAIRSSSSSTTDSSAASVVTAKKRPPGDSSSGNKAKRHRLSQETIEMALRFKQSYARYYQLHLDLSTHDNPDPGKVADLNDMYDRLSRMKTEIYAAVEA
ncbi:hypothetical protein N657DRAFT_677078 [Parathielavia appendiculata]|uniref:Uncharacterized protein n=1 Tax=Parathielavia appendiculata TaxID=2587402 RepID=A0AAN6UAH4_9PEZI|nr:hypothetical protein N657DRAFT_677078 [Parathielavia appendiculata]